MDPELQQFLLNKEVNIVPKHIPKLTAILTNLGVSKFADLKEVETTDLTESGNLFIPRV